MRTRCVLAVVLVVMLVANLTTTALWSPRTAGAEASGATLPFTGDRQAVFEEYVEGLLATSHLPGAAIAVVQDGEVAYLKGFGVRELGGSAPVTPDTLMMIGSVNKSLTSLLAATLVDDGRLSWETPVVSLLPGFAVADPALTRSLTVRDAFCACTGLPRHDIELAFNAAELTPEQMIASVADFPLTAPLGEVFQYSNQMYAIGGYAATAAIATDPGDLYDAYVAAMREHVLTPLGMDRSTFDLADVLAGGDYAGSHAANLSGGFEPVPLSEEDFFLRTVAPAGAMWSSAREMARYVQTELAGGIAPDGTRVVSEANRDVTWEQRVAITDDPFAELGFTGATEGYGLGWLVGTYHGQRLISHDGGTIGFTAQVAMLPDADLGVVILTNGAGADVFTQAVQARLFEIALGQEFASDAAAAVIEGIAQQYAEIGQHLGQIDPAAAAPLAGHYTNPALGDVDVSLEDGALVLDAGEARSALLPYLEAGEVVAYVAVDQPLTLVLVAFDAGDGTPAMAITDPDTGNQFAFAYTGSAASPVAAVCVAPALPPGSPTPPDEAAASAEAGAAAFPEPTPAPTGNAADAETAARVVAGFENLTACFGSDREGFAALATPNLIAWATGGGTNPYDLIASMEGEPPREVLSIGEVLVYADGRYSVDAIEARGDQIDHDRWYLIEEGGYFKADAVELALPIDLEALPGEESVVEVGLFNYAFGPSTTEIARADTIVFRATNKGTEPHVIYLAQYAEGTTAEQIIAGQVEALADMVVGYGGHFTLPGQTIEFGIRGLKPGVYFLVCDIPTATGTPHYHLGMVTQLTIV